MADPNPYAPPETALTPVSQGDSLAPILEGAVYPLTLRFKLIAIVPQVFVTDAAGRGILYVRQKLFKFKEHVEVFTDASRHRKVADIRANRVLEWTLRYFFTDTEGAAIGELGRKGLRSLWNATYDVFNPGDAVADFLIREENPGAKFGDALFGQIPVVNFFTGYLFHPRYAAKDAAGALAMRMVKQSAFWEGRFIIERHAELPARQSMNLLLSFLMMVFLERRRG